MFPWPLHRGVEGTDDAKPETADRDRGADHGRNAPRRSGVGRFDRSSERSRARRPVHPKEKTLMLTVGDKLPSFKLQATVSREKGKEFKEISNDTYKGKWLVLFYWPMDFTFICPTEIAEFGRRSKDFADRGAQVLGASTDTHFVHLAWRNNHADLKDLPFPMLADTKRELSQSLGILHKTEGVALRATFIVDPEGTIRWVSVNDLSVGRNVPEVLRVLDGLQTDELCPCNWEKGQATIQL
jgi:peroxiredoxin (alkyl hydroperoxide reductase subunit C)